MQKEIFDGIYLLRTPREEGSDQFEFRLAPCNNIGLIYSDEVRKENPEGNPKVVMQYFGKALPVDPTEASNMGFKLAKEVECRLGSVIEFSLPHSFNWYTSRI